MVDLNTLIPASSSLSLIQASSINDFDWIVGYAFDASADTLPAFSSSSPGWSASIHTRCARRCSKA